MPAVPVEYIDLEALRRYVVDHDALFDKLLHLFLEQAPLWIDELNAASARQDADLVRQVCHKIKGSAGTLQARPIIEAAADLNRHAIGGDLARAEESRMQLVFAIDQTMACVRASGQVG